MRRHDCSDCVVSLRGENGVMTDVARAACRRHNVVFLGHNSPLKDNLHGAVVVSGLLCLAVAKCPAYRAFPS